MTPRDSAGPVRSLKFVTLLVALSPDLLRWGAGLQLRDNGYEELLVALHPQVSEDPSLIPHIKEMITEASFYLFNATKRRVFFRSIKILIPATWTANNYSKVKQESYEKAQVLVTDWHAAPGDSPHTLQYRGCGKEGKYIHFTPDFLLNDALTAGYGSRGRVFVHEWAHLRWGVFDEYNREKPFYINGQNQVKVTRCSSDITGVFVCEKGPCPQENCIISKLFKEGCMFLFNSTQHATASIMFMQSLPSVVEFCNASTHNQEAPNLQNQLCSLRSAWDVIRASGDFQHSEPMKGTELPPPPTFTLLQAGDRVVCLVLDVSSRMAEADRLLRLQQAAAFYLTHMVESHTFVGIASFNGQGEIRAQLHQINSDDDRKLLVSYLPAAVSAEAEASVCSGLKKGFEVVEKLKGKAFGSVMILAASGGDQRISDCFLAALSSGCTVHTLALGSSAVDSLEELARLTGGLKFFVPDKSDSTSMIDAFSRISSGTGDVFQQHIQLESTGETVKPHHQLTNSVTVDDGVGNDTTFLVTWQTGGPPEMVLRDPNGRKYHTDDFVTSLALQTARLWIPGTAQPGLWTYTLNNSHHSPQALKVTVTSRASLPAVPPATVEAFVERDSTRFPHPMMIYAIVRRGFYPILNATVTATVEPEAADPVTLRLLDDGAGADVIKNDGIYSRYFFSFAGNGRYSLKVHVSHPASVSAATRSGPGSHAMYVPGYITNGNIQMNAPRKPVGRSEEEQKWGLSRAASGGSFSVLGVPAGPHPDMFPPCKIVDLEAVKVEEEVALSWTAPGEDFDQGQGNKQLTCSGLSVYTQCQRFTVHNILEKNDGVRGISNHRHITGISGDVYFIWHYERRHYGMNYFLRFSLSVGKISIKLRTTQDPYFCYKAKSYEIRISKSLQNIQDDFNSAILVNSSKLKPQQAGTKETFTFSPELFTNGPEHQADGETQRSHRIYVAIRAVDRNSLRSAVSNVAQASLSVPPNSTPVLARDDLILKGVLTAISFIGVICLTIVIIHCTLNRKKRADKRGNETKLL